MKIAILLALLSLGAWATERESSQIEETWKIAQGDNNIYGYYDRVHFDYGYVMKGIGAPSFDIDGGDGGGGDAM
jgi:hypothetical protein